MKGCYVGQEFISRIHHKGEIRKSVVGYLINESESQSQSNWLDQKSALQQLTSATETQSTHVIGENIVNEQGKSVGKVHSQFGSVGLAMLRLEELEHMDQGVPTTFTVQTSDQGDYKINPIKPSWWENK
jgi:folate-binding Fe-S cluster repair protein YgfZ